MGGVGLAGRESSVDRWVVGSRPHRKEPRIPCLSRLAGPQDSLFFTIGSTKDKTVP